MKIGIIGNGFVGSAIMHGFILHIDDIMIYDKDPKRSTHQLGKLVSDCEVLFVCVPTPDVLNAWSDSIKIFFLPLTAIAMLRVCERTELTRVVILQSKSFLDIFHHRINHLVGPFDELRPYRHLK